MIAVHVRPTAESTSVLSLESVGQVDCPGFIVERNEGTNTACVVATATRVGAPTRVDRTIEFLTTRYDNLLLKLAD